MEELKQRKVAENGNDDATRLERFAKWARKGSTSALSYMAMMWMMIVVVMYFIETFDAYARTGKTQIYADVLADGACFIGDNGWGLDEANVNVAIDYMRSANAESFSDSDIDIDDAAEGGGVLLCRTEYDANGFATTDSSQWDLSEQAKENDHGDNVNNTVKVSTKLSGEKKYGMGKIEKTTDAASRITYSGGLKIVREAWSWTYEHMTKQGKGGSQTPYVWGGGHGGEGLACLTNGADCSGYVSAIFRKCGFGSIVGESCTWGLEQCGKEIYSGDSVDEVARSARPGDIILIWRGGATGDGNSQHVTIYAGMHNGVPWDVECHGNSSNTATSKGEGAEKGAHIDELETGCSRYKVMRIVDSEGQGEEVPVLDSNEPDFVVKLANTMLREAGYNGVQIAGILGNFKQESGLIPIMRESMTGNVAGYMSYAAMLKSGQLSQEDFVNTGLAGHTSYGNKTWASRPEGFGLGQWTFPSRKRGLYEYAINMGSDVTDPRVQLAYLVYEMNGGLKGGFSNLAFMGTSDLTSSTEYFFQKFEGAGDKSGPARLANAQELYPQIGD